MNGYEQGHRDANIGWWGGFFLVAAIILAFNTGRSYERNGGSFFSPEIRQAIAAEKSALPVASMSVRVK